MERAEQRILSINADALNSLDGEDQVWKVYKSAMIYADCGLYVIPLRPNEKILPPTNTGINYGSASRNRTTLEKWFNPSTGRFKGWNIGLVTGKSGGIFVVDIDRHGEVDGLKTFRELESANGSISSPVQRTPSGGMHCVFQWEDNARSSTGKIGPGIDTRGGTESAFKAHIVVYPSRIDGAENEYKWNTGGVVPLVPDWIMERMGGYKWSGASGRGNEEVEDGDLEQTIPVDQLQRMLESIKIDELTYDQWLRVGQAINSQYPDDTGLQIWDEWSSGGERYRHNECRVRWRGFDPAGAIRVGSLFYYARKHGYERQEGDLEPESNRFTELVERMNEKHAVVLIGGKIRILRENSNPVEITDNHYELIGMQDFLSYMQNRVEFLNSDKPVPVAKAWLSSTKRREYPNGLVLRPNDNVPEGAYNTWAGFTVEPSPGPCELFLEHIRKVICGGDDDSYNWLLDWIADLFQDPSNPKGCAVVMRGPEGAGKGTLANTIGEMFGPHYRHLIDDSHLLSNFNAHMIDALFVFADEITWGGNKKTAGKLKGMVTERYLVGERKGIDAVGYRNMIRMMIASNSEWVIPAGSNSRRWFVLNVSKEKAKNYQYFRDINMELNNGGREALLHFFLNREITSNLNTAPETKALQEQRQLSIQSDTVVSWWVTIVESENFPVPDIDADPDPSISNKWPDHVETHELHADYERWCKEHNDRSYHLISFSTKIKDLGFKAARKRVQGKPKRVQNVPSIELAKKYLEQNFNIGLDDD